MIASYTGFVLMGFHLGLHYGMLMGLFTKKFHIEKRNAVSACVLRSIAVVIAVYGAYALYMRKFIDYIFQKEMFAYFDYDEPIILFLLDYASVMGLMIFIAYYLQRFLQGRKSRNMNTGIKGTVS